MTWGSANHHPRSMEVIPKEQKKRSKCSGRNCQNRVSHFGLANGVVLNAGCEFHVAMWVRDGRFPR